MRWLALVVLMSNLGGCRGGTAAPGSHGEPIAIEPVPSALPDASSPLVAPAGDAPDHDDVSVLIGGRFSPDHLGPVRYRELLDRLVADPSAHLRTLKAMLLEHERSPLELSELYPQALLDPLVQRGNLDASLLAMELMRRYREAVYEAHGPLQVPDGDTRENVQHRLRQRIDALSPLTRLLFRR